MTAMAHHETDEELRLVIQRIARRIRTSRSAELSDSQLSVLFHLNARGPLTPGRLAEIEHITPPSMNRTVNGLEDAGLVVRSPDPEDGRKVLVSLLQPGRDLIRATQELRSAWFSQQLAALDPDERRRLDDALPVLRKLAQA